MDPISQGCLMGAGFAIVATQRSPIKKQNIKKSFLIGAVGGGWGGWMSSQLWSDPSGLNVLLCSVVGVIVFDHFLRGGYIDK